MHFQRDTSFSKSQIQMRWSKEISDLKIQNMFQTIWQERTTIKSTHFLSAAGLMCSNFLQLFMFCLVSFPSYYTVLPLDRAARGCGQLSLTCICQASKPIDRMHSGFKSQREKQKHHHIHPISFRNMAKYTPVIVLY